MSYEDQVIEAAKDHMSMTPAMENLLRLVFRAGYKQGKIDVLEGKIKDE